VVELGTPLLVFHFNLLLLALEGFDILAELLNFSISVGQVLLESGQLLLVQELKSADLLAERSLDLLLASPGVNLLVLQHEDVLLLKFNEPGPVLLGQSFVVLHGILVKQVTVHALRPHVEQLGLSFVAILPALSRNSLSLAALGLLCITERLIVSLEGLQVLPLMLL